MIKGKTQSGFEFSVNETIKDNMEIIDALSDFDNGNTLAISRVVLLVLGKDQRQRFYDFLRREDGSVPTGLVEAGIMDMINALPGDDGKNS